jgi:hypothetical protein
MSPVLRSARDVRTIFGVEARLKNMTEEPAIILGLREIWGDKTPFGLFHDDRRHHFYVIGKSGVGKTTLLCNLILQDIEAGRGVGVIDPHGDLAASLLDHIPQHRIEDVVYFDPADVEYPIALNVLNCGNPDSRHLVASGIVSAFKSIWHDSWGPRLEYILYAAVAALLECENVSLLGIPRMLSDPRYRAWVVKQIKDPVLRSFWLVEFESYNDRFLQEAIAPIQNKVGQLLMFPYLRNVLGQVRSKIDARFMMDHGRIFIADLSKGKLGADKSNLLGALLATQFELAAISRATVPENERQDFFLYVDEFQSFISDSFVSMLSEARKYRLCLTLSHQYVEQLRPDIKAAVFGNVGSMLSFRVGYRDAKVIEQEFGTTYSAAQFTELSNYEACAKLLCGGEWNEPFRCSTLPLQARWHGKRDTIIRRSREKYSTPRQVVEEKINRWLTRN